MVFWGVRGTSWTSPEEGLCLPSTDFFYSYFQNQMVGYGNSEKAAGVEEHWSCMAAKISVPMLPGVSQPGQGHVLM